MEKETATVAVDDKQMSHNEIIDSSIAKLQNNDFRVYFYCPPVNFASGGMGTLLRLAKNLKEDGFNVKLVYQPRLDQRASYEDSMRESQKQKKQVQIHVFEKFEPTWMDFDLDGIEIIPLGEGEITFNDQNRTKAQAQALAVLPEDLLIIPEGFPDVMQKTMQTACKRIVLAQSWFYVLNAMQPGQTWQHFGIQDVVSVSDAITEYLGSIMPGLKVKNVKQGINRELFKVPEKVSKKAPVIVYSANRGQENKLKTINLIKTFYMFYPHLRWIRFVELADMSREEFADRVASSAFALYTDDIAGFGTLPLEAMACGTHVVGWASFGGKEYMNENNGFWTNNGDIFQTAELLGIAVDKWLNGELDNPTVQEAYEETLSHYTLEGERSQFLNVINEYKKERINELEGIKTK
jgi:glycosyltransferase involved in cell wall biosynthesis